jgi:Zn finger protein HypA/HybF involved in hydrogenase expression
MEAEHNKNNVILRCYICHETLKRNKVLKISYCPRCGLTRFPIHEEPGRIEEKSSIGHTTIL